MALIRRDRVADTLTGSGAGALTLAGVAPDSSYRTPADVMVTADTGVFTIIDQTTGIFETVLCTYSSSAHTLTPSTWYDGNGAANTLVNFNAGTKTVIMGVPAALAVLMGTAINWGAAIVVASATAPDIGAAAGNWISMTGSVPVTSFVTATAGMPRWIKFAAGIVLTYNSSSLILPGSESITTAADDTALFVSLGSGNWECIWYCRRDGRALNVKHDTIASASTTELGSKLSQSLVVSGVVTITSFGSTAPTGDVRFLTFSGGLTLTYNAVSMKLTGSANISISAGDSMVVRHEGGGVWSQIGATGKAGSTAVPAGAAIYTAMNFGAL